MKHDLKITLMLVMFFVLAQLTGLYLINKESGVTLNSETNSPEVSFEDTAIGGRPETTGAGSFIYVLIAIFIGTILVLTIAKYGKTNIWRIWFFLAVWMALCVSFGSILGYSILFPYDVAILLAIIFTCWKIFRPNIFVHNFTEILMYSGIGLIIIPLFDLKWALILLIAISVYDMYAVWKSKHMIKLAKFQSQSNMFAGLMIPYELNTKDNTAKITDIKYVSSNNSDSKTEDDSELIKNKTPKIRGGKTESKNAILGGGDIVFPLIFIGAFMNSLILSKLLANPQMSLELIKQSAFLESLIIVVTTTISLILLFFYAKKDRFYPAMPFLTAGCLIGWVITLLI